MNKVYLLFLFLVGVVNFLPMIGLLSLEKINQTYGLSVADNNLAILLRHRALLFGLIGGFVFFSLFKIQYQTAAMTLAAVSMLGYLVIFWSVGGSNSALLKVAQVDIIGLILLIAAVVSGYILNEN